MNSAAQPDIVSDEIVPAGGTWGRIIRRGKVLRIIDLAKSVDPNGKLLKKHSEIKE